MSPFLKRAHVGFNTVSRIEHDFIIVHLVGYHGIDLVAGRSRTNVLSVATTAGFGVMSILTALGDFLGDRGKVVIPFKWVSTVVGTMCIVLKQDGVSIFRYRSTCTGGNRTGHGGGWR